jgi:hypothetical protein
MYNDLDLSHFSIQGKDLADPNQFQAPDNGKAMQQRNMMLAKLLSQSKEEDDGTEYVNGWAVKQSPYAGIGSLLGGIAQAYMMGGGNLGG